MSRKPIAITTVNRTDFDPPCTMVICDDGSIWEMSNGLWERLPDIPQNAADMALAESVSDKFNDKRAFIASVILSGILANRNYDPPRKQKIDGMCDDAISFADCLITKLNGTEESGGIK